MLVSSSEGFARDGLFAAILLRALMIAVVLMFVVRSRKERDGALHKFRGGFGKLANCVVGGIARYDGLGLVSRAATPADDRQSAF